MATFHARPHSLAILYFRRFALSLKRVLCFAAMPNWTVSEESDLLRLCVVTFFMRADSPSCPGPKGTYSPTLGQTSCLPCAAVRWNACSSLCLLAYACREIQGFFANTTGLTACLACPKGTNSVVTEADVGPSNCTAVCRASVVHLRSFSALLQCAVGKYGSAKGQSSCTGARSAIDLLVLNALSSLQRRRIHE